MTEFRFYHLVRQPLTAVLPVLLEKSLARDWRCVVRSPMPDRIQALNRHLWTYREESFLAHGTNAEGHAADQPIWLTVEDENPNGAVVLFLVDGADTDSGRQYDLVCLLFNGNDAEELGKARNQWQRYKDEGFTLSYWQQGEAGGWEMKRKTDGNAAN